MKKKSLLISVAMLTIPLFSSCGSNTPSVLSASSASTSTASVSTAGSSSEESSTLSSSSSETLSSSESLKGYYKADVSSYSIENNKIISCLGSIPANSIGNLNVYVIPVSFSGADDPQPTTENLKTIEASFFGESSETGWESISSYYYKSSYGKLNIKGTVGSIYTDPRTALEVENEAKKEYDYSNTADAIITDAINAEKENGFDFSDYDLDKDGYLDVVAAVYFTDRTRKNSEFWWSYSKQYANDSSLSSPNPAQYFWTPFTEITNGYYSPNLDTHTIIHEMGHILGLFDYYTYDYDSLPCGGIDMMDMNLGDHNAYSKMMLGWTNPYVVDGTSSNFSITLNSFTETGDCLILRNTETDPWNGMPYDEYLLLQYYTPTGLNEKDCNGYPLWSSGFGHGGTYDKPGLQVFHIDSRLYAGKDTFSPTTGEILSSSYYYTDTIIPKNKIDYGAGIFEMGSTIAASNSHSRSVDVENAKMGSLNTQIALIPSANTDVFLTRTVYGLLGDSRFLFGVGGDYYSDTFTQANYKDTFPAKNEGKFNDGTTIGYSFKVTRNDESSCDISIYKD